MAAQEETLFALGQWLEQSGQRWLGCHEQGTRLDRIAEDAEGPEGVFGHLLAGDRS